MASKISPLAHIEPTAKIGDNVLIKAFAYIGDGVEIGDGCEIMSFTSIHKGTRVGKNNKFYDGSVIGADPQDFRWNPADQTYLHIGDNNVIREHVIINRGIHPGEENGTRIGNDCFIMANSHIGHDANIHGRVVIGNSVNVSGNVEIDECCILSSGVILHENARLAPWVLVKGGCRINGNVPPFVIMAHNPAEYYGVNSIVMRKQGFTEEEIDDVAKAYRHIYQSQTSVFNALKRVEADVAPGKLRDQIVSYIRNCGLRIIGVPADLQ
ncbi:MAG: acyl-ACP--UDP-N-acetylglucosamine O-acyltransferase [Paramuribaculum sp.]|nr:acyl-ACP--UDP-N-acetylglucosamine O-acyltransferase [Paramuribaculum sp.]MDE7449536.1 acyl-ACP--UDP-N-acetylglucosamine O-acyltransferase [Paramuribaculum sp.]